MSALAGSDSPAWSSEGDRAGAAPSFSQLLPIQRNGPEPLYYQLAQSLGQAVESGTIPHGTKLLADNEMAHELHLSIATVRRAWGYLERMGLLSRTRKRGTFVR
ncbi:winged helix-turn-helix domain-containing protein [Sinomonas terrae]|uniref:Winged helix-turn-helix domain-containing protein n=1 Tax=Sinomonas terrae TaxID=2908838 RepID=A0ABS9U0E8_9MICC|nr:winged helix-turn-helix domain-containing protein [Sinomonas terrae]MCH6470081.1 winged helix-turn-helix domain-containing protein [Sinomonas terrae]